MPKYRQILEKTIKNIEEDRDKTSGFINSITKHLHEIEQNSSAEEAFKEHKDVMHGLSKYLEVSQRSNEQLVKIANLLQKDEKFDEMSESDYDNLLDDIQKDKNKRKEKIKVAD